MLFNLTSLSDEPMHSQIAGQLLEKILADDDYDGSELPAVRTLACEQHVNIHTIEKAYQSLVQDGLIISRDEKHFYVPAFTPQQKRVFRQRLTNNHSGLDIREIERELHTACQIQASLLPKSLPQNGQYLLAAHYQSAKTISGDFYDYLPIDENRFGLVIGDACGKGLPAAMLISQIQAMIKSEANNGKPIEIILQNLNKQMVSFTPKNKFVTLFYGIFDKPTREFIFATAGHSYPILIHTDGNCKYLRAGGPGLGIIENAMYETGNLQLNDGDILFLYTDGITEAMTPTGEEYGEQRLLNALVQNRKKEPRRLIDAVLEDVDAFNNTGSLHDDRTMLVMKIMK